MGQQYKRDEVDYENNSVDTDMVVINGFCFCAVHSIEYCIYCTCDYRMGNNAYIEDYLEKNVSPDDMDQYWEGDDRHPILLIDWKIFDNGKPGCVKHQTVGCQKCYDWGKQLADEIKAKKH